MNRYEGGVLWRRLALSGATWRSMCFRYTAPARMGRWHFERSFPGPSFCRFCRRSRGAWWRWRPAPARIVGPAKFKPPAEVRLIAPVYVKPFVKRQKNDMADAEAITEAAARPTMRFVAVKSAEKQASGMVFKTRDLLVRQRTQTINALRGHLAEHGIIAPQGIFHVGRLAAELENADSDLPRM